MAHEATRVIADEAAQYQSQSDSTPHVADGDFGVMNPPFFTMWIEWQTPRTMLVGGKWEQCPKQQIAAVVQQIDENTLHLTSLTTWPGKPLLILPVYAEIHNFGDIENIDCKGQLLHSEDKLTHMLGSADEALGGLNAQLIPAYLTLGWMNCRNVSLRDSGPPKRLLEKRARKRQFAGLDYKRIVIDEKTRQALAANNRAEDRGQRLHIVRGHIKHYTAERPLFGKLTGNYWWHQQMRGDAALGRINHEYHVQSRGTR